jgi:hypothetical protein
MRSFGFFYIFIFFWITFTTSFSYAQNQPVLSSDVSKKIDEMLLERGKEIVQERAVLWKNKDNSYAWKRSEIEYTYKYIFGISKTPEQGFMVASEEL